MLYDRLGSLLGRAHLGQRRVAASYLAEIGIDPREVGALGVLVTEGPHSQQHLGGIMGIDRSTMVAVTDGLESKGLVQQERNPRDRRAYALVSTPRGHRLLARATDAVEQAESGRTSLGFRPRSSGGSSTCCGASSRSESGRVNSLAVAHPRPG